MFRFEKLDAWKFAIELADLAYKTKRSYPADKRFGLTNQIRRSAVSVSANVAEGSGRASDRDNARFVEFAYGSLMETVSHAAVAHRQGSLTDDDHPSGVRPRRSRRTNPQRLSEQAARNSLTESNAASSEPPADSHS